MARNSAASNSAPLNGGSTTTTAAEAEAEAEAEAAVPLLLRLPPLASHPSLPRMMREPSPTLVGSAKAASTAGLIPNLVLLLLLLLLSMLLLLLLLLLLL
jgi:hypothetical protein